MTYLPYHNHGGNSSRLDGMERPVACYIKARLILVSIFCGAFTLWLQTKPLGPARSISLRKYDAAVLEKFENRMSSLCNTALVAQLQGEKD
jgi:hypothetical protein